eukprot:TRINITY_DN29628_c0_g1_i1.p1 TRINITY_DN29628_c0_g1~~TRINITY_DN29628_c0_g1_i1.p1  ORF type:complete len:241 (-),score=25.89 TRINITY_DN29628_c0_g1_i1:60-782(-)
MRKATRIGQETILCVSRGLLELMRKAFSPSRESGDFDVTRTTAESKALDASQYVDPFDKSQSCLESIVDLNRSTEVKLGDFESPSSRRNNSRQLCLLATLLNRIGDILKFFESVIAKLTILWLHICFMPLRVESSSVTKRDLRNATENSHWADTNMPSQDAWVAVVGEAAAIFGGVAGNVAGFTFGGAIGLVLALFTFGLSIPFGVVVGGFGGKFLGSSLARIVAEKWARSCYNRSISRT